MSYSHLAIISGGADIAHGGAGRARASTARGNDNQVVIAIADLAQERWLDLLVLDDGRA